MLQPFFNHQDHRLRAFWRLLIQFFLFRYSLPFINMLGALTAVAFLLLIGRIPFSAVSDVAALNNGYTQALHQLPFLNTLATLLVITPLTLLFYKLLARFLDQRSFRDFGFHLSIAWWRDLGFGLFLGALLMAMVFSTEFFLGWIRIEGWFDNQSMFPSFWLDLINSLVFYILVGISEELFARGYLLRNLAEGLNLTRIGARRALLIAYLASSAVFDLLHLGNPNATWISTLNLALAGLFLGLGFVLTGELAIPIGLHITWNFFQGNIFGFPVSGSGHGISLVDFQQLGPDWMTGGVFGPEAGLLGILAILLGSLLIGVWIRKTHRPLALHTSLAEYCSPSAPEEESSPAQSPAHQAV